MGVICPAAHKASVLYFSCSDSERALWEGSLHRVIATLGDDSDPGGAIRTVLLSPAMQSSMNVRVMSHANITDLLASVLHPSWRGLEELQWAGVSKSSRYLHSYLP